MPDITKVQMIMDRLQVFFAKWLGEHLRRVYPKDFWEEGVLGVLTPEQRENALDDGAKCLDDLDFAALIAVFLGNFRLLRREAHLDAELSDLAKHVKLLVSNVPIVLTSADILSGKIRFIFRNVGELKSILGQTKNSVSECKVSGAFSLLDIDIASYDYPAEAIEFSAIKVGLSRIVAGLGLGFDPENFAEFERRDRRDGAVAGYNVGKWVRSVRGGYCLNCFRDNLSFESWMMSLPNEFSSVLNMICNEVGFRWDVNRDKIVSFCSHCWHECFEGKDGVSNAQLDAWHDILRKIAKSHMDPTYVYPVRAIEDKYMQALACFINAGRRPRQIVESIVNDRIVMPELALALHGALVGYSVLSRILFQKSQYDGLGEPPPPMPPPPPLPPSGIVERLLSVFRSPRFAELLRKKSQRERESLEKSLVEAGCEAGDDVQDVLNRVKVKPDWGTRTKVYKELKKMLVGEVEVQGTLGLD